MARRGRHSKGRKIWKTVFIVVLLIVLIIVGIGTKFYLDVSNSVQDTYESVERSNKDSKYDREVNLKQEEPFSVLLLGIDTGDLGRTEQGRSDTLMVATVNPKQGKTTLLSIPRDTYVSIIGHGTDDKINHAYAFGGAAMSMDTVENFLDIPIDHYVSINMAGIKELVDAVGGVDVNNDLEFTYENYTYDFGQIHLNGDQALGYLRMRYDDPEGDYGRQGRQRAVVEAVVKKAISLEGATQYKSILNSMEDNMKTDMSFQNMQTIALNYRNSFSNINQIQMKGEGFMQDGVSYQRVDENELETIQNDLQKQLNISK